MGTAYTGKTLQGKPFLLGREIFPIPFSNLAKFFTMRTSNTGYTM